MHRPELSGFDELNEFGRHGTKWPCESVLLIGDLVHVSMEIMDEYIAAGE